MSGSPNILFVCILNKFHKYPRKYPKRQMQKKHALSIIKEQALGFF